MRKSIKILLSIVVVIVLIGAGGIFYLSNGLEAGANVKLSEVDLTNTNDGEYLGKYNSGRFSNELKVTVKNNKITEIKIIDDVTFAKPEVNEELFAKVIRDQSTKVDSISGATVTSKAYLMAIENAFNK